MGGIVRFVHFSDTHLGAMDDDTSDPSTGLNIREQDLYRAFNHVIDYALASKPDFVIHAGDLFDAAHPGNRALCTALEGFGRLSRAGIPSIVIAGNHDTPRIPAKGNVLRALRVLPNVHAVYDGEYQRIELGRVTVHAVGDAPTTEGLVTALQNVEPVHGRRNILVIHAGTSEYSKDIHSGEFNEHHLPHDLLVRFAAFDYIALGHYHRHMLVRGTKNAYYSGSTERLSFNEAKNTPGFVEVTLDPLEVKHLPTPARAMIDLGQLDCRGKTHTQILEAVSEKVAGQIRDALARILLSNISPAAYKALDLAALRELTKDALDFNIEYAFEAEEGLTKGPAMTRIATLSEEFARFVESSELTQGYDRDRLKALGLNYIATVEEADAG